MSASGTNGTDAHERTFTTAGREIIAARLSEFRTLGAALYHPHASRRLHRLRIAAKRLRYALELFVSCGGDELKELASEVARLQTSLGELHDRDEWIADLSELLEGRAQHGDDTLDGADVAAGTMRRSAFWLLDMFMEQRSRHLRAALERWARWETDGFFARLSVAGADLPAAPDAYLSQEKTCCW